MIYVEPLASCTPMTKDIRIFEQKQKNSELEKELKATMNFQRGTITVIAKLTPQVIVILYSKEEVEIRPQLVVEEHPQLVLAL
jgi:hypothetical protein